MGRKKIPGGPTVHEPFELRPFCYYCDREFDTVKTLIQHQRTKHLSCAECGLKFDTVTGLRVHMLNAYKKTMKEVPGAIPGRENPDIVVHGMEGVPKAIIEEKTKKAFAERAEKEKARAAERAATTERSDQAAKAAAASESQEAPPPAKTAAPPKKRAAPAPRPEAAPAPPAREAVKPLAAPAVVARSPAPSQPEPAPAPAPDVSSRRLAVQLPGGAEVLLPGLSPRVTKLLAGESSIGKRAQDQEGAISVPGVSGLVPATLSGLHPAALRALATAGLLAGSGGGAPAGLGTFGAFELPAKRPRLEVPLVPVVC